MLCSANGYISWLLGKIVSCNLLGNYNNIHIHIFTPIPLQESTNKQKNTMNLTDSLYVVREYISKEITPICVKFECVELKHLRAQFLKETFYKRMFEHPHTVISFWKELGWHI